MNILVTGARAPISADIAKALALAGHSVWMSDSLAFPVGRFSPFIEGYVRISPPRTAFSDFAFELSQACHVLKIDRIIPTSEEVFWLAAVTTLPAGCVPFCPPLPMLEALHNKASFASLATALGYGAGTNQLLSSRAEVERFIATNNTRDYVFKPVFSRFASSVLVGPSREEARALRPMRVAPWLAQTKAVGTEVCTYNIAVDGELLLHTAYRPRWRAGKGAGVYFEPVVDPRLRRLSERFVAATSFTGQASFDVIDTGSRLVALECNPRGTSGVHLAAQDELQLGPALVGQVVAGEGAERPAMLALPHALYNPGFALTRAGRKAWREADDVMRAAGVPLWAQCLATVELVSKAFAKGKGALAMSTADIEWNGEAIPAPSRPWGGASGPALRRSARQAQTD